MRGPLPFFVSSLGSFVLFTIAGCSSESGRGQTGDDQNITQSQRICGGVANACPSGFTCHVAATSSRDAPGTCVKSAARAKEGAPCGGLANIACAAGLTCRIGSSKGSDPGGTCMNEDSGSSGGTDGQSSSGGTDGQGTSGGTDGQGTSGGTDGQGTSGGTDGQSTKAP